MDLFDYVHCHQNDGFSKLPLNEVDALILCMISYINFGLLTTSFDERIAFSSLTNEQVEYITKDAVGGKNNNEMLKLLIKTPRFKDLEISYIKEINHNEEESRFFAMTFFLPTKEAFIVFRGTDITIIGWKESINMGYLEEIPSQTESSIYLNEVVKKIDGNFYIGGHSKGGNLAYFSAYHLDDEDKKRIILVYNFDGPGFLTSISNEIEKQKYLKNKLIKIVPYNTLVGILLNNTHHAKVVDSKKRFVLQHDGYNWSVDCKKCQFVYLKDRSWRSYVNEITISKWLSTLSREDVITTCAVLYEVLDGKNTTVNDLTKNFFKVVRKAISIYNKYDDKTKAMLKRNLHTLINIYIKSNEYYRKHSKDLIKNHN